MHSFKITPLLPSILSVTLLIACSATPHLENDQLDESAMAAQFIKPMFSELNCEKQGIVEPGEVDEHFNALFFYTDKNRDRVIQRAELNQDYKNLTPIQLEQLFTRIDSNADDKLNAREYRDYIVSAVIKADLNNDGELTEKELHNQLDGKNHHTHD